MNVGEIRAEPWNNVQCLVAWGGFISELTFELPDELASSRKQLLVFARPVAIAYLPPEQRVRLRKYNTARKPRRHQNSWGTRATVQRMNTTRKDEIPNSRYNAPSKTGAILALRKFDVDRIATLGNLSPFSASTYISVEIEHSMSRKHFFRYD
ncbi:uncharacterized protein VTP21DRAFT_4294 [Calcarisporiella thermophila]|uniref:uncharacterized protein n=1 Tax=Calcarisporiella thermophila TaxID=911321 RepID=UPI003742CEF5